MITVTVDSQREAIDATRTLTRAANIIRDTPGVHDIEQTGLIDWLCALRDATTVKEPVDGFAQYVAAAITGELENIGFKVSKETTAAVNLFITVCKPMNHIDIKFTFDETAL